MKRRGLGKGLGKGYKNIITKDPYVHGLSAKGVKTRPLSEQVTIPLMNRTIVDARQMNKQELAQEDWDTPTTMLILDDGTKVYPSIDDEGNNSGVLFGSKEGELQRFGYHGRSDTELRAKKVLNVVMRVKDLKLKKEDYSKGWEHADKIREYNMKILDKSDREAKKKGTLVGRYFTESVADGQAYYLVINENKKKGTVVIEHIDDVWGEYVHQYFGYGKEIDRKYVKEKIAWQDRWRT